MSLADRGGPLITAAVPGTSPETIGKDDLLAAVARDGYVLLRGFASGITEFGELVRRVSVRTTLDPARTFHGDIVQAIDPGDHAIPLHSENSTTPFAPDLVWFYCAKAAATGSQTTVADGYRVWNALTPAARRAFSAQDVVFAREVPGPIWRTMVSHLMGGAKRPQDVEFADLHRILGGDPALTLESRPGGAVYYAFRTPAVHRTRFGDRPAFCNSLLNPGTEHYAKPELTFADGSPVPDALLAEVAEAGEAVTEEIDWRDGDVVVVDNTRVMHGRRAVLDPARSMYNAQSFVA
jgi:alpha-ketoglutarate-dependent taurine dioxygenase